MEERWDIAIVGLGPAGATLARLLRSADFRVIALDQKEKSGSNGFHKPCGGLLAPDAQKTMAEMGLNLQKEILVDPQVFSVRTIDLDTGILRFYQRAYINMDRHKFDLWLKSLIPPCVEIRHGATCTDIERKEDGYCLTYAEGGHTNTIHAGIIVGADGAKSIVRRFAFPRKKMNCYLSIQQHFSSGLQNPFYSCIFDSESTDCYSWGICKDHTFVFGGAYPMKNARERFENQKRRLIALGFIRGNGQPDKTEACLVLRPKSFRDFATGHDNLFLIGEAAGLISPSSLEGISYAMKSARLLAEILNAGGNTANTQYHKKTAALRRKLILKRLKCPFMYQPLLRKIVMKSGIGTIQVESEESLLSGESNLK